MFLSQMNQVFKKDEPRSTIFPVPAVPEAEETSTPFTLSGYITPFGRPPRPPEADLQPSAKRIRTIGNTPSGISYRGHREFYSGLCTSCGVREEEKKQISCTEQANLTI